jgi:SAM-dependent methyltransferase
MSQLLQHKVPVEVAQSIAESRSLMTFRTEPISAREPVRVENSLFERFAWLYAFFREKLFRDDTTRIIRALWPTGEPPIPTRVIELGCGPGFYSCNLAERFPSMSVLGVDCSLRQLECAQKKARSLSLSNCEFYTDNVLNLSHPDGSFDALVAARLFTVLPNRQLAMSEMYRILRPGGRCFIAEPRYAVWASLPLLAMWLLAGLTGGNNGCREPRKAIVLSAESFEQLCASQPWKSMKTWQDGRYQYALCEKG